MLFYTKYYPILFIIFMAFSGCTEEKTTQDTINTFNYGTTNDSARHYFLLGWSEIMDNGRWTKSEAAFRKALAFDPDWLLGKSMVGRITQDTEERKAILAELEADFAKADPDEQTLLTVNLLSLQAANHQDEGNPNEADFSRKRWQLAEQYLGAFAKKYPDDDYFKAEHLEIVHLNQGAAAALDTLNRWTSNRQKQLGFYLGFAASLALELGHIKEARQLHTELLTAVPDSSCISPLVLDAQIWMAMDSFRQAKAIIDQAVQMDPKHLIAQNMQTSLEKQLAQE